jgi:hypothetical protein
MAALIYDLDGTLVDWDTGKWMPGVPEMLRELKQEGHQIIFMTYRGYPGVDKKWSAENTLPLLEELGIEYRVLFGVPSPRIIFDDSPTACRRVGNPDWSDGAEQVRSVISEVEGEAVIKIRPCRVCGSDKLLPKFVSATGEKWVHCDSCGNCSTPVVSDDRVVIIANWNAEQEKDE